MYHHQSPLLALGQESIIEQYLQELDGSGCMFPEEAFSITLNAVVILSLIHALNGLEFVSIESPGSR